MLRFALCIQNVQYCTISQKMASPKEDLHQLRGDGVRLCLHSAGREVQTAEAAAELHDATLFFVAL